MRTFLLFLYIGIFSLSYGISESDSLSIVQKRDSLYDNKILPANIKIRKYKELIAEARSLKMSEAYIKNKLEHFLAHNYSRIGDFDRAIEIALELKKYYVTSNKTWDYTWACNDLGVFHSNAKRYEESILYFEEAVKSAKQNNLLEYLPDFEDGIALNLVELGRLIQAKLKIDEVDRYFASGMEIVDETRMFAFYTKARYYQEINQNNRALEYFQKVAIIGDKCDPKKAADARLYIALIYLEQDNLAEAHKELKNLIVGIGATKDPSLRSPYLMEGYNALAQVHFKLSALDSALYFVNLSEGQYSFFHSQYTFDKSKLFHDADRRYNLGFGVKVANELHLKTGKQKYLVQALLFADQAKSNVLNERMQVASLVNSSAISKEIRELRFQWVYQLNEYESSGNTENAINLRNSLDSLDQALGLRKQKVFDEESIKTLRQNLAEGQLVLEYFVHDESLYIFSITRNDITVTKKAFTNSKDVLRFYTMLQNPNSSIVEYKKLGNSLYEQLLPKNMSVNQSITIIPDGVLYYLPFDALPTVSKKNLGWSTLSYLGTEHTISYDFSLQTLTHKSENKYVSTYTGFAPRFDDNPELTYLTSGSVAVQQGKSALGGTIYENVNASTDNLRNFGCDTRVLQLYTHAVSSDSSYDASYIYMADKKMYVDEILTLPLRTDLCLLTACEVGLGKEYNGEGVTGVAWAFKAAGAQNVVQSLWRINQESSSFISERMFDYLSDNVSSVEALKSAKQDYLANEDVSERLKHPYYWAGMSHYGSGSRTKPWSLSQILLISGVLSIGVFGAYFARKRL